MDDKIIIMKNTTVVLSASGLLVLVLGIVVFGFNAGPKNDKLDYADEKETFEEVEVVLPIRSLHFGDLMLDRGVQSTILRGVNPFEFIADFINEKNFDLVTANLEGPFAHPMECQDKPYSFRFEPEYVTYLQTAGITAVSLSNNHTLDCFSVGLRESKEILTSAGIEFFGGFSQNPEEILYKNFGDTRYALLGFDDTMKAQTLEEMVSLVRTAASQSEIVLVNIHWGEEYFSNPTDRQHQVASALSEAGAHIIIGHHPHVVEPVSVERDALVFYSLGNFVFDQLTLETQTGYGVEISLDPKERSALVELHPYLIVRNQPTLLDGEEKLAVCESVLQGLGEGCVFEYGL